jgi:CheY-like chemotaxis protein
VQGCEPRKKNSMSAKILIAEDERDIRDLVAFSLRYGGFEVVEAGNGQEAVEQAVAVKPDLILMDVRMPKMTGYEACKQLKSMPDLKHIPVIFLSAKGQEAEIQQGLDAGAEEYILKPFAPEDLVNRVRDILKRVKPGK